MVGAFLILKNSRRSKMGLINKLFKSRDYPKIEDRTVGSYYSFYMGFFSRKSNRK